MRNKDVKKLIINDLAFRFKSLEGVAVVNPRGIGATQTNLLRRRLHEKGLKMMVVRNALARRAVTGSKIAGFESLLDGPSALIYGKESGPTIARVLLDVRKADEKLKLELRGIFFDGETYAGEEGIKKVSKFPTREEAISTIVAAILSPGKKLAGVVKGPGSKIASLIKSVEEKAKEREDAAPKVEEAVKVEEAPKAAEAPKAEDAPKAAEAPKAEEAPKAAEAVKVEEAPKVEQAPKADETPKA